ncbi:MAG: hypothetical protein ACHQUC_03900 [Chlamydiales bacterium]
MTIMDENGLFDRAVHDYYGRKWTRMDINGQEWTVHFSPLLSISVHYCLFSSI